MDKRKSQTVSTSAYDENQIIVDGGDEHFPSPDYTRAIVRDALEHLASIEPINLCHEAKVEQCRATRDLSSCGRCVQHVLTSCGHACLCAECSQRCDICPICRTPIPKNASKIQLRLYNKCLEAGLISKWNGDAFQESAIDGKYIMADVQRLYSLFNVVLENNLVSLVSHYVTDVCMDESAVSSDPVLAFLLDEVVVKDWCKQKFKAILSHLCEICILKACNSPKFKFINDPFHEEAYSALLSSEWLEAHIYALGGGRMDGTVSLIQKLGLQLSGLSNVMEVLESFSIQTLAENVHDLHHLSDSILKAKQHSEVMAWCVRHGFLENVRSCYLDYMSWSSHVHERKAAAMERTWPDISGNSYGQNGSTLFIEDALSNLTTEQQFEDEVVDIDIACLQEDTRRSSISSHAFNDTSQSYPFKNLRAAADILFLHGTSDMMVAKQATFLYYLFDRHWTMPESEWRHVVDDFATAFGISRHLVQESLSFYLLDDHREQALQAVERLLPEIVGPEMHGKIPQVLIERQRPELALMVLRCSGQDGFSGYSNSTYENARLVSLGEAITAIRVRIECGLLTEAFMYQRTHCTKVKEERTKYDTEVAPLNSIECRENSWIYQIEVLVTEICSICIWRNLVDRMIELPWNCDEETFLCKCLYENACRNPSSSCGSLLVVFYLQRYRYAEAYQLNRRLSELEEKSSEISETAPNTQLMRQWRTGLVDRSIELLPEIQRMQAKTGKLDNLGCFSSRDTQMPLNNDSSNRVPTSPSLQPNSREPSLVLQTNKHLLLPNEMPTSRHDNLTSAPRTFTSEISDLNAPSVFLGRKGASLIRGTSLAAHDNLLSNLSNGRSPAIVRTNGIMTREMGIRNSNRQEPRDMGTTPTEEISHPTRMRFDDSNMDFLSVKRETPARNFQAGQRWRSDESSDEEMEVDLHKILGREVSIPPSSRRRIRS